MKEKEAKLNLFKIPKIESDIKANSNKIDEIINLLDVLSSGISITDETGTNITDENGNVWTM